MPRKEKKKIVIVGGGFGGIYVAGGLRKLANRDQVEVVLISPQNYFLFTPLLHEVATGGLSPTSVAEPIREIFRKDKIKFIQSKVGLIDIEKQVVLAGEQNLPYDFLVLATGAETNFYKIHGAERYGLPLKTLADSVKIRSRIIDAFEKASLTSDHNLRREYLTFVVVGGGATGVEMAGEIAEFTRKTLSLYYQRTFCQKQEIRVILVSSSEQILNIFPKNMRIWSEKVLSKKGVEVLNKASVKWVSENGVSLDDGKEIKSRTVIWTAGVLAKAPEFIKPVEIDESGRILVDEFLRLKESESVFVLGDIASFRERGGGKALPMFAQVSVAQSNSVVKNIKAILQTGAIEPFSYKHKGFLVSIGQWRAVGTVFGLEIHGRLAWWLWRTVYLFKFISCRKKIRIAFEWTLNLFYPRDMTKIG